MPEYNPTITGINQIIHTDSFENNEYIVYYDRQLHEEQEIEDKPELPEENNRVLAAGGYGQLNNYLNYLKYFYK